jgi:hypothetical protein
MSSILEGLTKAAEVANPVFGAAQFVTGFFGSISARRRRKRQARERKRRAIKSENLLLGAAGNVVEDVKQQEEFTQQSFDLGQQAGVRDYRQGVQSMEDVGARTGLEKSSTYLQEQFQLGQEQASLGLASEQYQLEQQKESRLRDIQSSLLELSPYSKRNINVLDMYNIS